MVGFEKSDNAILIAGRPHAQELKVETTTSMIPGRLVKKGTTDADAVVGTAGCNPLGVLGYEQAHWKHRPATIATAYAASALAPVLNGPMIVKLLATGASIVKGDALVAAADGKVTKAAAITVAVPSGSTTVTSSAAQPDLTEAGSLPPSGPIVAFAEESQDASSADKAIIARWML